MEENSHELDRAIILGRKEKKTPASRQIVRGSTHSKCMYIDIGDNCLENITNRYYNYMIQEHKKSGL
jgi:hypothetical protein